MPGEIVILEEGERIPADAIVLKQNDVSINESIITGKSLPVDKNAHSNNLLYQGTTVNSVKCYAKITATGSHTILGKLGKSVATYVPSRTLLQQQVSTLVQKLALFGLAAFLFIFAVNFWQSQSVVNSLLFGQDTR